MAEYYAVLKKAVGGLAADSSDARRAVYEKARNALIGQLKAIDPPLTTSEISRQRLELEEAIRRIEREAGATYAPAPPPPAAEAPEDPGELDFDLEFDLPQEPAPRGRQARPTGHQETFHQAVQVAERQQPSPRGERRDAPVPQARAPGRGRQEPSFDSVRAEPKAGSMRSSGPAGRGGGDYVPDVRARGGDNASDDEMRPSDSRRAKKRRRGATEEYDEAPRARGSRLPSILLTVLILAILGGAAALGWSQRDFLAEVIASFDRSSGPPTEATPAAEGTTRAPDSSLRDVGEGAGIASPTENKDQTQAPNGVAVAQKAILYEESRAKAGDVVASLEGVVTWKYVGSGPNGPVVEADLSIPERELKLVMTIRKNLDAEMPASHLVEITATAGKLPGGGIDAIPRLVMKPAEEQKGQPLAGTPTKVIDGLYWIALAGGREEAQSNISIMRQSGWFDMPLLYKSGQRAILTFEKGQAGREAFDKAFAAWGN